MTQLVARLEELKRQTQDGSMPYSATLLAEIDMVLELCWSGWPTPILVVQVEEVRVDVKVERRRGLLSKMYDRKRSDRVVTYQELCDALSGQGFTPAQLMKHWRSLPKVDRRGHGSKSVIKAQSLTGAECASIDGALKDVATNKLLELLAEEMGVLASRIQIIRLAQDGSTAN